MSIIKKLRDGVFGEEINDINNDFTLTSKDIIRQINPIVIPRISAISNMALCERAAYSRNYYCIYLSNNFP